MKPNAKWLKNALRWIKRITDNISQNNKSHKHAHTIQWKWLHCDIQENIWIRYRNVISTLRPKKTNICIPKKSRIAHTPKGKTNWNDTRTTYIHGNPFWWFLGNPWLDMMMFNARANHGNSDTGSLNREYINQWIEIMLHIGIDIYMGLHRPSNC